LINEGSVDERERRLLQRALRELGYEPADFSVQIAALAPTARERSLPGGTYPRRKEVIVTRISSGDIYHQEQYLDGPWAGEVVQALIHGHLGPKT
jgi:hypothetical protein